MAPPTPSRGSSVLTAVLLAPALLLLGVLVGGFVATRVFPTSGMGWDGIANALGGVIGGCLVASVVWVLAIVTLGPRGRVALIGIAIVGSTAMWMYLQATPPPVRVPRQHTENVQPPPVAPFTFQLGTADGLEGPNPGAQRLPWQRLRINSTLSFDYVLLDRPDRLCLVTDGLDTPGDVTRFTTLREELSRLPRDIDCGEPCPACDEVILHWSIDEARSTLSLHDRCWLTHERLQPLRAAIDAILTPHRDRATCENMED